jgi:hypothetical protein
MAWWLRLREAIRLCNNSGGGFVRWLMCSSCKRKTKSNSSRLRGLLEYLVYCLTQVYSPHIGAYLVGSSSLRAWELARGTIILGLASTRSNRWLVSHQTSRENLPCHHFSPVGLLPTLAHYLYISC